MFLVILPTEGDSPYLFFWTDPHCDGCPYAVIDRVELEDLPPAADEWRLGDSEPHVLARSRRLPKRYRIFRSELDVRMSWDILPNSAEVWASWETFTRICHGESG